MKGDAWASVDDWRRVKREMWIRKGKASPQSDAERWQAEERPRRLCDLDCVQEWRVAGDKA